MNVGGSIVLVLRSGLERKTIFQYLIDQSFWHSEMFSNGFSQIKRMPLKNRAVIELPHYHVRSAMRQYSPGSA